MRLFKSTLFYFLGILCNALPVDLSAAQYDALKNLRNSSQIKWVVSDDIVKACEELFRKYKSKPPYVMDACSVWDGNKCTIVTKRRPSEADVGHEVMHCFQEHFHK